MGDHAGSSMPQWKGLFDWSMSYNDGTRPADFDGLDKPDPEKIKWLEHVLSNYMVDFAKKMEDMMDELGSAAGGQCSNDTVEHASVLLEELHEIVESIDFARDLRSIGGLPILRELLGCSSSELRWRAAEVVAACAQNHISVQEWMLQEGMLDACKPLLQHDEVMDRRKGLLAISSIVRGYTPAMVQFLKDPELLACTLAQANESDARSRRKAIEMAKTVGREAPHSKLTIASSPGFLDSLSISIDHDDPHVLSSAIGVLHELVDDQQSLAVVRGNQALVDAFVRTHEKILSKTGEEREAVLEEVGMSHTVAAYLA